MPRKKVKQTTAVRNGKRERKKDTETEGWVFKNFVDKDEMTNERMFRYYKAQNIVPDEEWDSFIDSMKQVLPTTFRVAGSRQTAHALNETIQKTYVPALSDITFEDEKVPAPSQISWYPDGLAWQFNVPKKVLRKSPEFRKFHSFLVFETDVGNVSRQEAVSMLPPLFLEVEPHHRVIDMCAAPGSKTAQLLEALHAQDGVTASSVPSGLLIANDSDYKRTHMLIHQSARLPSPAVMVTNVDASIYPTIRLGGKGHLQEHLFFDRILCDVPCSGDGTLRKNVNIWKRWQPMDGNGLHGLQLRILQRAIRMLKEDGRIVYSTCSMNPVENEAVIAAVLNLYPEFEVMDVATKLPELVRRPGLTSWRPTADRSVSAMFSTYKEYIESLPEAQRSDAKMAETHWPPANIEELGLTRCLRIYPHLQDTGGFFIAVLQRKAKSTAGSGRSELKREADCSIDDVVVDSKKPKLEESSAPVDDHLTVDDMIEGSSSFSADTTVIVADGEVASTTERSQGNGRKGKEKASKPDFGFKENPFTYLSPDDPALQSCIQRLNLIPEFPLNNMLVRNPDGDAVRGLYLTNDIVKRIVRANDYTRIRLMTCGTKVFAKQEAGRGAEAQFRVLGEGLPVVLPYIDPTTLMTGDVSSLRKLLEVYYPLCESFAEPFKSDLLTRASGSHIVCVPAGHWDSATLTHDLVLPLWKSNVSVSLMIDKKAKSALSLRLFGEDISAASKRKEGPVPNQKDDSATLEAEPGDTEMVDEGEEDEVTEL